MDPSEHRRFEMGGAIVHLASGEEAVHVTLQVRERLPLNSRDEMRALLRKRFEQVGGQVGAEGGEIDLSTISDLAQSVEALLPTSQYEVLVEKLAGEDIRVDPLVSRVAT